MQTIKFRALIKPLLFVVTLLGILFSATSWADSVTSGIKLSEIASHIDTSVSQLSTVLTDISLIAGVGFVMASFFKFHQHKLNPTQVPISQGVTLLLIGAALVLFPSMLPTAKNTVFGTGAAIAKVGGTQIHSIIGS